MLQRKTAASTGPWRMARNLLNVVRGLSAPPLLIRKSINSKETVVNRFLILGLIASTGALLVPSQQALAHGDVTPQLVDVSTLPKLGEELKGVNPFRDNKEAVRIGTSAYNQNCARCHGLDAISGGIAPDLRKLDLEPDTDVYFIESVRGGKVRNGAVYMPPFKEVLQQEAIWAIKAYLETRRASLDQ